MRFTLAIFSFVLLGLATWFLYAGFSIDTAIPSGDGSQAISNLQLMHVQLLDIILGAVSFLASCILFAGSAIVGSAKQGQ